MYIVCSYCDNVMVYGSACGLANHVHTVDAIDMYTAIGLCTSLQPYYTT